MSSHAARHPETPAFAGNLRHLDLKVRLNFTLSARQSIFVADRQ